jgi:hypothetical protein
VFSSLNPFGKLVPEILEPVSKLRTNKWNTKAKDSHKRLGGGLLRDSKVWGWG